MEAVLKDDKSTTNIYEVNIRGWVYCPLQCKSVHPKSDCQRCAFLGRFIWRDFSAQILDAVVCNYVDHYAEL